MTKANWTRRCISGMLTLAMVALAAGCGNSTTSSAPAVSGSTGGSSTSTANEEANWPLENTLPISDGSVTLKLYCNIDDGARQSMKDLSEQSVVKEIMKQTGLKLEFIHPPAGDDGTYFNATIASGEYPDLIYTDRFNSYPGGAEGAMGDKVLINLDELISQYAPNFLKLVADRGGETDKWIRGDSGSIIKFGTMFLPPFVDARVHNGPIVRKDLLDKYGLSAPVTLDEYTNVLKTFKENGVEVPYALTKFDDNNIGNVNPIASAFGVSINDFQHDGNGKVSYSRTMPEYKDFLEFMAGWAEAGYIDRDFISRTHDDTQKLFFNGRAGIVHGQSQTTKKALTLGKVENPDYAVEGLLYPRKNKDDEIKLTRQALSVNTYAWYVSTGCKNPVEAVKFIDYLYMDDTRLLTAWGLGNEEFPTWEEKDGVRVFTDFMQNNPNMDYVTARQVYTCGPMQVMYDDIMERSQYNLPENIQVWEAWSNKSNNTNKMPHVMTMTVEESKEFAGIKAKMDNYANEMVYKFIFGETPISEFDSFLATLNSLGAPRAIEIQQQAYDRFMKR